MHPMMQRCAAFQRLRRAAPYRAYTSRPFLAAMAMPSEVPMLPHDVILMRTTLICAAAAASANPSIAASPNAATGERSADEIYACKARHLQQSKSSSSSSSHGVNSSQGTQLSRKSAATVTARPAQYNSSSYKVFADADDDDDDQKSIVIVCYRDRAGELVCEGRDEGPYFEPSWPRISSTEKRSVVQLISGPAAAARERAHDLRMITFMGGTFCEGRDEG